MFNLKKLLFHPVFLVFYSVIAVLVSAWIWVQAVGLVAKDTDIEVLKQQNAVLIEFIDRQLEQNKTFTANDFLLDARIDMLEQKMRKVYGGYDLKIYLPETEPPEPGYILELVPGTNQLAWVLPTF